MRLYIYFSVHEPLFHEVARVLRQEHDVETIGGFVWGNDQAAFLRETGFPWWRLDVFTSWLPEVKASAPDLAYLAAAERRYGYPNFSRMVFSERHLLKRYGYLEILKIVELALRHFEDLCERERPDAMFVESVDGLVTLLLHAVASAHGIPVIHMASGRMERRVSVTRDPFMTQSDLEARFEERRSLPLTGSARAAAEKFLETFRDRPAQRPRRTMFPRPRFDDLSRLVSTTRRYHVDRNNPVLASPLGMVRQKALRLANHWLASRLGTFEQPVAGERYVLYPLHFQPEASTLVMGTYYLDQPSLIEDIAKSLPLGFRLYVKEHFLSLGRRPLEDYRRIRRCFGVRLIDPLTDPMKLAAGAAAIATVTGTMGWEAILMERPTITFGDCFYNSYPQVYRAGLAPKAEWPTVFREALTNFKPDRELLLKYIASVLESSHEGYFSFDNPVIDPDRVMREENYRNIASVVAGEMKRFLKPELRPAWTPPSRLPPSDVSWS